MTYYYKSVFKGLFLLLVGGFTGIMGAVYGSQDRGIIATLFVVVMVGAFMGAVKELNKMIKADNETRDSGK